VPAFCRRSKPRRRELRKAALTALQPFDDPRIRSASWRFTRPGRSIRFRCPDSPDHSRGLVPAIRPGVEAGRIKRESVPLNVVRKIKQHKDESLAQLAEKIWATRRPLYLGNGKANWAPGYRRPQRHCNPYNAARCSAIPARSATPCSARWPDWPDLTSYQRSDLTTCCCKSSIRAPRSVKVSKHSIWKRRTAVPSPASLRQR